MKKSGVLITILFAWLAVACTSDHEKIIQAYYKALFAGDFMALQKVMIPQQATILLPMMGDSLSSGKFRNCTVEKIVKKPDKMPIGVKDTELKITEMTLYNVDFKCGTEMKVDKMLVVKQDGELRVGLKN